MATLIQQVRIAQTQSSHYNQIVDIVVADNNVIEHIAPKISGEFTRTLKGNNLVARAHFIDLLTHIGAPGFEQDETLLHAAKAAYYGGYGAIYAHPFYTPKITTATHVHGFLQMQNNLCQTKLGVIGSITTSSNNNQLADMLEMHEAGVNAFTFNAENMPPDSVVLKAMEFLAAIKATLIAIPSSLSLFPLGLMHEGFTSTAIGVKGLPAFAEILQVEKLIAFCKYTNCALHIAGISSKEVLPLIAAAKAKGLPITCSVSPMHISFTDEALHNYDTYFKINTPLRSEADRMALIEGLQQHIIDGILAHHNPKHADVKDGEFDKAAFGVTSVQTTYYALKQQIPQANDAQIEQWLSICPSKIVNSNLTNIEKNNKAQFTVIDDDSIFELTAKNNFSKSFNTPFKQQQFKQQVLATFAS
jgi:dihydroorotase